MNGQQPDKFYQSAFNFTAETLKNAGMKLALEHAEQKVDEEWGDKCFRLLKQYLEFTRMNFMTEEFRRWCEQGERIAEPPSKRAYGAVIIRAVKNKLIARVGFAATNNANAHRTPASVWKRKDLITN